MAETLEFKSELKQILTLITHSLYSHKEIFLRELISNASDAIDRLRFDSLNNEALLEGDREWKIRIIPDKEAKTLTVSDNGIGMSRESIIANLGTIAKSGTREFLDALKSAEAAQRPELIGQFGVGFYSAFMVADRVTVISRPAGESHQGVRWSSEGQGEFTVEEVEKPARGTDVILHLKEDEKEFLEPWHIRQIVKQFSDFIEHPIVMNEETTDEKSEKKTEEVTLNSRKALWLRSKTDVTQDEYNAFYRQIANDFEDPAKVIHYTGEGVTEFKVLLFIPRHMPFDMRFGQVKYGPKLYIRRVLIMDHCEQLLPAYLRFVKGVVDSADLPLNVSREMLQQNPLLDRIQKSIVRNVLKTLEEMKSAAYDEYVKFFGEFGSIVKEGLSRDWANREQIADLALFESLKTARGSYTTLAQYVEKMPGEQKEIYYLAGESREVLEHAPYLEAFRERGWDILFLTEPIDEFVLPGMPDYKGKKLRAADREGIEPSEDAKARVAGRQEQFQSLLGALKGIIKEVKDVRLSTRLRESAACLVTEQGAMGAHMERLMQKLGRMEEDERSQRILELNPDHPAVEALLALHSARPDDPRVESFGWLLYDQALIAEGSHPKDPTAMAKRMNELMVREMRGEGKSTTTTT